MVRFTSRKFLLAIGAMLTVLATQQVPGWVQSACAVVIAGVYIFTEGEVDKKNIEETGKQS